MIKILVTFPSDCRHFTTAWESTAQAAQTLLNLVVWLTTKETRMEICVSTSTGEALAATGRSRKSMRYKKFNYCGIPGHWERECRIKIRGQKGSGKHENPKFTKQKNSNAFIKVTLHTVPVNAQIQDRWCLDSEHCNRNSRCWGAIQCAGLIWDLDMLSVDISDTRRDYE